MESSSSSHCHVLEKVTEALPAKRWQVEDRTFKFGDLVLILDKIMHRSDRP